MSSLNLNDTGLTPEELLKNVNQAIIAITVGGQSYTIGSRSLTRANLTELRNLKNDIEAQIASKDDNGLFGNTSVAYFDGR